MKVENNFKKSKNEIPYNSEYQIPEILKTNEQMNYKLNVHDLTKCLTTPLTDVNHRCLNLHVCTHSLNRKITTVIKVRTTSLKSTLELLYVLIWRCVSLRILHG